MSFIHPYLLFGLLLAGVPVLLHLFMRQKPKRLQFPAFRFLKQRFRTNQRKLNLQNLLLLLLRIAVICAICLALARPRFFADRLGAGGDRAVIAVLLFDTSPSMEYTVGGVSRFDDARRRARELLDEMHPDSRVAVAGIDGVEDVLLPPAEARLRIDALKVQPGASSLNRAVEQALKLLERQDVGEETPPRLLCVLSDGTRAAWDEAGLRPVVPEGVRAVWLDVGVEKPKDLGIENVEVIPPVVAPGNRYEVRMRLRGTPGGHEKKTVTVEVSGDPTKPIAIPADLKAGYTGDTKMLSLPAPEPPADGPADVVHQVTAKLAPPDSLAVNDVRHATFLVRRGKKLLTIVADEEMKSTLGVKDEKRRFPTIAKVWDWAIMSQGSFAVEYCPASEVAAMKRLADYPVVCLFQVGDLSAAAWQRLTEYVRAGGGLAIVPGGNEMLPVDEFNQRGAALLPAALDRPVEPKAPKLWERFTGQVLTHPLANRLGALVRGAEPDFDTPALRPFARRYWRLKAPPDAKKQARSVIRFQQSTDPALGEREVGTGRVVLFTTPLDMTHRTADQLTWDNYWESSFVIVLPHQVCLYLGGESDPPPLNFRCGGPPPQITLPAGVDGPFTLHGPGLSGAERNVAPAAANVLTFPQALQPGNYRVLDAKERVIAGFSLDVPAAETDLTRASVEHLQTIFGKGGVVPLGRTMRLREALSGASRPPLELLPYLMIALLLVLTFEGFLANRFYRRAPQEAAPAEPT